MEARCTGCNNRINFRATRGNRLSDHKCKCGSKYERMNSIRIEGKSPNEDISPTETAYASWGSDKYVAFENSKGVIFLLDYRNNKFIQQ